MAGDQELLTGVVYIDHSKALDILDRTLLFKDIKLNWGRGECSQLVTAMLEKMHRNQRMGGRGLEQDWEQGCAPSSDSSRGARTKPLT